jgi:uncharacterized protein with FMN-binding domain
VKRAVLLATGTVAGLAGVLLINPTSRAQLLPGNGTGPATTAIPVLPTPRAPAARAPAATSASNSPTPSIRTVDGRPATIPYGVVQVRLIITGSTITDVQALQLPNADRHSQGIAQLAAPALRQQVLSAQSAQINGVSGATYTSSGYAQSVQSALDSIGGHP